MNGRTILVVEDNPLTRKMLRLTLETEGYEVREAGDGRTALAQADAGPPDLAIVDFVLPDQDGLDLLARLREALAAPQLPALLVTGMVSQLDELRSAAGLSTQVVPKPIEPARLVQLVQAHLAPGRTGGPGRPILIVDDEPLNRKLTALRLENAGFRVATVGSGEEALRVARADPPHAILADVMMPSMDGFDLCRVVRRDPLLAAVPLVLVSASYVEAADQELALQVGASALVARTADLQEAIAALHRATPADTAATPSASDAETVSLLHLQRLQAQVQQQAARNKLLAHESAIQATALSVVRALSEALGRPEDASRAISDVLVHCLDATGLSTGLLYLSDATGRLRVGSQFGVPAAKRALAENGFGCADLMARVARSGQPAAFSRSRDDTDLEGRPFLDSLGHSAALLIPFAVLGRDFGILLLASDSHELSESAWLTFGRSLAAQFSQTVALGESLTRLAASEARLQYVLSSSPAVLYTLQPDPHEFRPSWVSENVDRLLGFTAQEALAPGWWPAQLHPDERDRVQAELASLFHFGRVTQEYRCRNRRGEYRWIRADIRLLWAASGEPLEAIGSWVDVTARKEAEQRSQASAEQYRILFEGNPHPMYVIDAETLAFLAANRAAVHHSGYSAQEFLGMTLREVWPSEEVAALLAAMEEGGDARPPSQSLGLFTHNLKDGTATQVEVSASRIQFNDRSAWLTLAMDVTEKRNLEAQLQQAQKMESIGRLAGGVAHDFNNILGVITGYGGMLRRGVAADPVLHKYAEDVMTAAERAARLTRQLLAFSRKQVLQPRHLDLNVVVGEMERMLRRIIGEDVALTTRLRQEEAPQTWADPGQIEQVLMNLVVNARDAMPRGGRLLIETGVTELDARYVAGHPGVQPGRYAMLAVTDDGEGMSEEVQSRAFEPFFTTKEPGKGTGLGLATVHGIVKQSGGHVFLYSEPGRGASFKVYLPIVADAAPALPSSVEEDPPRGSETILVVEDEEALRGILQESLSELGYEVLEAREGTEAVAIAEARSGPIHLLLTDLVMPGIGGNEIARRLTAGRPGLKVLYMSGYTDDAVVVQGVLTAEMPFLGKPFSIARLARKLREILDRP